MKIELMSASGRIQVLCAGSANPRIQAGDEVLEISWSLLRALADAATGAAPAQPTGSARQEDPRLPKPAGKPRPRPLKPAKPPEPTVLPQAPRAAAGPQGPAAPQQGQPSAARPPKPAAPKSQPRPSALKPPAPTAPKLTTPTPKLTTPTTAKSPKPAGKPSKPALDKPPKPADKPSRPADKPSRPATTPPVPKKQPKSASARAAQLAKARAAVATVPTAMPAVPAPIAAPAPAKKRGRPAGKAKPTTPSFGVAMRDWMVAHPGAKTIDELAVAAAGLGLVKPGANMRNVIPGVFGRKHTTFTTLGDGRYALVGSKAVVAPEPTPTASASPTSAEVAANPAVPRPDPLPTPAAPVAVAAPLADAGRAEQSKPSLREAPMDTTEPAAATDLLARLDLELKAAIAAGEIVAATAQNYRRVASRFVAHAVARSLPLDAASLAATRETFLADLAAGEVAEGYPSDGPMTWGIMPWLRRAVARA